MYYTIWFWSRASFWCDTVHLIICLRSLDVFLSFLDWYYFEWSPGSGTSRWKRGCWTYCLFLRTLGFTRWSCCLPLGFVKVTWGFLYSLVDLLKVKQSSSVFIGVGATDWWGSGQKPGFVKEGKAGLIDCFIPLQRRAGRVQLKLHTNSPGSAFKHTFCSCSEWSGRIERKQVHRILRMRKKEESIDLATRADPKVLGRLDGAFAESAAGVP